MCPLSNSPFAPSGGSKTLPEQSTPFARPLFLYVKIPVTKDVVDPIHSREDAIDQALRKKGVGSVLGWGSSLGEVQPDGSREVAYTRIDIDVTNIDAARTLLQATLPALVVPAGTEIHYTIEQQNQKDVYVQSEWLLNQPDISSRHTPGVNNG
jgi:hypothetical protein